MPSERTNTSSLHLYVLIMLSVPSLFYHSSSHLFHFSFYLCNDKQNEYIFRSQNKTASAKHNQICCLKTIQLRRHCSILYLDHSYMEIKQLQSVVKGNISHLPGYQARRRHFKSVRLKLTLALRTCQPISFYLTFQME